MVEYALAKPSDTEAIAHLHTRSWRENYRGEFSDAFLDHELPDERIRVWRGRLERPAQNQFVLIAVDGAALVGFVCAYGAQDAMWGSYIDNLHVVSGTKRGGIGTSLMRQAGRWLAHFYSGHSVYLWVLESNAPARRFYERLGAQDVERAILTTPGGAVQSCRYIWPQLERLS